MDESSAKRRERLNAMRLDASNQSQSQSQSASSSLSNPLLNPSSSDTNPQPPQRFDFYTDPVGSFSGSKTRNQDYNITTPIYRPNIPGPRSYHVGSHQNQAQSNRPPNHSPWRSPIHHSPYSGNSEGFQPPNHSLWRSPIHHSPYSGNSEGFQPPNHSPWRSPIQHSPLEYARGTPPPSQIPWRSPIGNTRGTPPSYNNFSSPNFRPRGSPYPNSRHSHSGGRGQWNSNNYGYYKKTMVVDPWRDLTPIVGDILVPLSRYRANPKRLKVGESSGDKKLSLAENLALSLEEAANEKLDS